MKNYNVLRDVGETLKKLLRDNITELDNDSCFSLNSPAEMESFATPKLSLFLYQIAGNDYFKNGLKEPAGEAGIRRYPPLVLDLYYLLTPYAQDRETEIIILERLADLFHNQAVLSGTALQGQLAASGNESLKLIPNSLSFDELNKLWERFPSKPFKLSLAYLVTPVRILSDKTEEIKIVTEKVLDIHTAQD